MKSKTKSIIMKDVTKDKMDKKEFTLRKELIELRHKYRMEEIESEIKGKKLVEMIKHEKELERTRIKTAEINKSITRKADMHRW